MRPPRFRSLAADGLPWWRDELRRLCASEVSDGPEHVDLARHGSIDSDRLVDEEGHVCDDQHCEDGLQRAREPWAPPEKRQPERTENHEEQDQDPHRAEVPL